MKKLIIVAALLGSLLIAGGCQSAAHRPVKAPPPPPPVTAKVVIVNGFKDLTFLVKSSNTGQEVELGPLEHTEFPLGTTLIFTFSKGDNDVGVYSRNFPAARTSRVKDQVFVVNDPKNIQQGVLSGIP